VATRSGSGWVDASDHRFSDNLSDFDQSLLAALAGRIIAAQDSTLPYLVYLEDKALLFDDRREAFIMYGVQGRTWVALGDPVGRPALVPDLIRLFIARCDDYGGTPVFYEVGTKYLHHYADFGLTFVKVGEEAGSISNASRSTAHGGTVSTTRAATGKRRRHLSCPAHG